MYTTYNLRSGYWRQSKTNTCSKSIMASVHVTGSRFLQLSAGNHGLCIGYFLFCLFVLLLMFYEFNFHLFD